MTSTAPARAAELVSLDSAAFRRLATSGAEYVLLDISEGRVYESGHISVAVPVPASEVELRVPVLAPRRSVPLVVTWSGEDDIVAPSVRRLREAGYDDVRILTGGNAGWQEAGNILITGLSSLSKALGEYVERRYHTPTLTPRELSRRLEANVGLVVVDTRPEIEYRAVSIPTGIDAPGVELLRRIFDLVESAETEIVVNCGGRTRAIIGAQTLINVGLDNPVVSLENGTTGWRLDGLRLEHGADAIAAEPSPEGRRRASEAARELAERLGVEELGRADLARLRAEAEDVTLYLCDVRTPEEYQAGHVPGSRQTPGGQLLQSTDTQIGSRNGRIVVIDDADGVRARVTASWLLQLGYPQVFTYLLDATDELVTGRESVVVAEARGVDLIEPRELAAQRDDLVVVDLEPPTPTWIERAFIPGSFVARRSTLAQTLGRLQLRPGQRIVFTSYDGRLAALAAADQRRSHPVVALAGGTAAWVEASLEVGHGHGQTALDPAEAIPAPESLEERRVSYQAYVDWGDTIVELLERDGLVSFVELPPRRRP